MSYYYFYYFLLLGLVQAIRTRPPPASKFRSFDVIRPIICPQERWRKLHFFDRASEFMPLPDLSSDPTAAAKYQKKGSVYEIQNVLVANSIYFHFM